MIDTTLSNYCSRKRILALVVLVQLLICLVFQAGMFELYRSPVMKVSSNEDLELEDENNTTDGVSSDLRSFAQSNAHGQPFVIEATKEHKKPITDDKTPRILPNSIAIGLAITSRKSKWRTIAEINTTFPFFKTLLPTFCATASVPYSYHFFLAFDKNDPFFTKTHLVEKFQTLFLQFTQWACDPMLEYSMRFVKCTHEKRPAWAQNDAMLAAYMDNMEYYYRINDDTKLSSNYWTEVFIKTLQQFDPPNVGVVGPTHTGGNTNILTYDFVHYTHVEIHGLYYPHLFTDWHADRWITDTYRPGRCVKVRNIVLRHTLEKGQRYRSNRLRKSTVSSAVNKSKALVERYVRKLQMNQKSSPDHRKVIVMSLTGHDAKSMFGAVRNLQLHKLYLADWTVRVYVLNQTNGSSSLTVPKPAVDKLTLLGANVVYLNASFATVDPKLWRFLVLDDSSVDLVLIRNVDHRLSDAVERMTEHWLDSKQPYTCVSNGSHVSSNKQTPVDGLIGFKRDDLSKVLPQSVASLLSLGNGGESRDVRSSTSWSKTVEASGVAEARTAYLSFDAFIEEIVWPAFMAANTVCYSNDMRYNRWESPQFSDREAGVYLDTVFNEFDLVVH